MKSIEELQHDLKSMYNELEKIKLAQVETKSNKINFKIISSKAKRYPIKNHPMYSNDDYNQQLYITMLLSVAVIDEEKMTESLSLIYRIAYGMKFEGNIEELLLTARQMNFDKLDECTRIFAETNGSLIMVLESMLIAGTFDKGRKQAMEYIAEICLMLNVTVEESTFLANLAKVVLTQDINEFKCDIPNTYDDLFDCYLENIEDKFEIELIIAKVKKTNHGNNLSNISCVNIEDQIKIKCSYEYGYKDNQILDLDGKKLIYLEKNLKKRIKKIGIKSNYIIGVKTVTLLASSKAMKIYNKAIS